MKTVSKSFKKGKILNTCISSLFSSTNEHSPLKKNNRKTHCIFVMKFYICICIFIIFFLLSLSFSDCHCWTRADILTDTRKTYIFQACKWKPWNGHDDCLTCNCDLQYHNSNQVERIFRSRLPSAGPSEFLSYFILFIGTKMKHIIFLQKSILPTNFSSRKFFIYF